MAKKNSRPTHGPNFFRLSQSNNPLDNILAAAANIVVGHGLHRLSRDVASILGLTGISPEDKIKQAKAQLSLKREEISIAREELTNEKRSKLLDLEIQENQMRLEKARQQLERIEGQRAEQVIQIRMEPISGALEIIADAEGLSTTGEQMEAYQEWIDSLNAGKVILVLGKRGSGKTAFIAKIAEFLMAVHRMPTYWIGVPETAQQLVPHWIKLVDTPENCPVNSFVMCDEAGVNYLSLLHSTSRNRLMRRILMIARQKQISLAFATQSSIDVDWSVIRQSDSVIFKEPSLQQTDSERSDIKPKVRKAAMAFKEIPREERLRFAYVFDHSFEGIIESNLPSFWTEDLSHIYAQLDLSQIENRGRGKERLQAPIDSDTKLLGSTSLEQDILELSQQGNGIEKIAKTLGCTTWTVRKCLDKNR